MPRHSQAASRRPGLNPFQRAQFLAEGVVALPGLIPGAAAEAMADRLWADLAERYGVVRGRPQTWRQERPAQFQALRRSGAFAGMRSEGVVGLLDDLFGEGGWAEPAHWGGPLVTFPAGQDEWDVPAASWHLDIAPGELLQPWPRYVRLFAILAPLEPGGGGTVYAAGSHRLAMRVMAQAPSLGAIRSAAVTQALKASSRWVAELCAATGGGGDRVGRFMRDGTAVAGVDLRVGEMTGAAGDVWLMHPAMLHAGSGNRRTSPRLMLAESVYASA